MPENLTVHGILNLSDTPIQSIPEGLNVSGGLYLQKSQIQSLPNNLTVGGSLNLYKTPIQSLPENLTIGGDLDLQSSQIKYLPEGLSVNGGLYLKNMSTLIQSLPENFYVRDYISSDASLDSVYRERKEKQRIEDENIETGFAGKETVDELIQEPEPEEEIIEEEKPEEEIEEDYLEEKYAGIDSLNELIKEAKIFTANDYKEKIVDMYVKAEPPGGGTTFLKSKIDERVKT